MYNTRTLAVATAIICIAAPLFFTNAASAAERSCKSSSVSITGSTDVGSTSVNFSHRLPDSYLRQATETVGQKVLDTREKARKRACKRANESTVTYARAQHTVNEMARLMCATAKLKFGDEFSSVGNRITLKTVYAESSRENRPHSYSLGNQVFACNQFDMSSDLRKASQFCADYATSAIKMDLAIEQLGCAVEHHPADGHRNYCSTRSDETVKNGIKHKRGLLNTCLDGLPLH